MTLDRFGHRNFDMFTKAYLQQSYQNSRALRIPRTTEHPQMVRTPAGERRGGGRGGEIQKDGGPGIEKL